MLQHDDNRYKKQHKRVLKRISADSSVKEEMNMSSISSGVGSSVYDNSVVSKTVSDETTAGVKKTNVSGMTIGNPQLSEKAAKYYEELKKKFSNMDFILVSEDQKERAQAQAGNYANANRMVVLIDEAKIEKMAEDDNYRRQYEGIIANASSGISHLKNSLAGSSANVKTYGIKINDNGLASYFAVLKKSSAAQKERIEKKAEEKKEAKKAEAKKAEKEKREEWLQESRDDKKADKTGLDSDDTVTITAPSAEELLNKINDYIQLSMSDNVLTEQERNIGYNVDFSV